MSPLIALALVLFVFGCAGDEPAARAETYRPTATIQDIMLALVDPGADIIWNAVGTIATHDGIEERRPRTDEDWAVVRQAVVRLLESTNLLLMEGRQTAAPGVRSENLELELHPEQIDELIADDPATWRRLVDGLYEQAKVMLDAVEARDPDALFANGGALDRACENCHRVYWYPEAIANPSAPGRVPVAPSMRRDPPAAPGNGGTIEGHVRLDGELPGNQVIRMGLDPGCALRCDPRVPWTTS